MESLGVFLGCLVLAGCVIISIAAIVVYINGLMKDHEYYRQWDELGLRKDRAKNFYIYAQYFVVNHVDYLTLREDLMTHALEYHIVGHTEDDPKVPNCLVFQKSPASWTANVTLISQEGSRAVYQFRFSSTKSNNGKLVDREYMNAMQSLVESTIRRYDPNAAQVQKELNIQRSVKVKVH